MKPVSKTISKIMLKIIVSNEGSSQVMEWLAICILKHQIVSFIICLAIGFSVGNVAHFCMAYNHAPIDKYECNENGIVSARKSYLNEITNNKKLERHKHVIYAINSVGGPITLGNVSTILGTSPLMFIGSLFFRNVFKIVTLTMTSNI